MGTVIPDGNVMVCTGVAAGNGEDAMIPGGDAMEGRSGGTAPPEFKNPNGGRPRVSFLMFTVRFQPLSSSFNDSVRSCVSESSPLRASSSGYPQAMSGSSG
jgi:hypothetical protein